MARISFRNLRDKTTFPLPMMKDVVGQHRITGNANITHNDGWSDSQTTALRYRVMQPTIQDTKNDQLREASYTAERGKHVTLSYTKHFIFDCYSILNPFALIGLGHVNFGVEKSLA